MSTRTERREARAIKNEEKARERADTRRVLRVIGPYIWPEWRGLIGILVLLVAGTVAALLAPWPYKFLLDEVFATDETGAFTVNVDGSVGRWLIIIAAAIAGISLLKATIHFLKMYVLEALSQRIGFRVRIALYDSIQDHSLSFHQKQRTGDLLTRVTKDVDKVQELTTGHLVDGIDNFLTLVGMVAVFFYIDWQLSLGMLALIPLLWITTAQFRRMIKSRETDVRSREGEITSIAQEAISSIRLVKSLGRERFESSRFERHSSDQVDATLRVVRTEALFAAVLSVILGIATGCLVYVASNRVLAGAITIGQLIVFVEYIKGLQGPTRSLSKFMAKMTKTALRASKIVEILDEEPGVSDRPGASDPGALGGHVRLENVSFGYDPNVPVLDGIDLDVAPGQVLAVVGSTGAGKSTIASLIPRLYDPSDGRVLIDEQDIRDYTLEGLRNNIAVVLQESVLMHASIAQNIEYGRPGATDAEIVAAAKAAHAHEFIEKLPDGYDSLVGERGATLSGGQRQRIAIARALVRDAPILLLDEPTTGLDADAERVVLDALDNLMKDRTTVVIAHKLSTVRHADIIVVLDEGRIREAGTHDDLLARGGRYAELHAMQFAEMHAPARAPRSAVVTAGGPPAGLDAISPSPSSGNGGGSRLTVVPDVEELLDLPMAVIQDNFDLGEWQSATRLRGGKNRHWHVVSDRGEFFVRGSRRAKTLSGLEFEHALLDHLRADDLSTPRPVTTSSGRPMVVTDRIYTVTAACPGTPYNVGDFRQIASAGATLARYHDVVRSFELPDDAPTQPSLVEALSARLAVVEEMCGRAGAADRLRSAGAEPQEGLGFVRTLGETTVERLAPLEKQLDRCAIHAGFRRGSVLFEGTSVRSLLDFDSSRPEARALDLAVALHDWSKIYRDPASKMNKVELDLDTVSTFAQAYRREGGVISALDREAIPLLMQGRRVRRSLGRFLRVLEGVAGQDDLDKIHLEMRRIRWLTENETELRGAIRGPSGALRWGKRRDH